MELLVARSGMPGSSSLQMAINIEQSKAGRICYLNRGGSAGAAIHQEFEPALPFQQRTNPYDDAVDPGCSIHQPER
jgi:hypothetical protein